MFCAEIDEIDSLGLRSVGLQVKLTHDLLGDVFYTWLMTSQIVHDCELNNRKNYGRNIGH